MHVRIPNAKLAYLSACESAGMDESRPDEGLNLAGAMIFAGFKSVIATMW
jgi:CHAT domain-containing protein